METKQSFPVFIIGAGPVALAVAAQLALRNQFFLLFEEGNTGASQVFSWGHVPVFSP